jgi:uncharacterized cofD-like protein
MSIALITGGSSSGSLVSALKICGYQIDGIVSAADSGGKGGLITRSVGVPILSDAEAVANQLSSMSVKSLELLSARIVGEPVGVLSGMRLTNVILYVLRTSLGLGVQEAIDAYCNFVGINGHRVLIVSEQSLNIVAIHRSGRTTLGEHLIDYPYDMATGKILEWRLNDPIVSLVYDGQPSINAEALSAIQRSDAIVTSPSSFWTSIAPIIIFPEMVSALRQAASDGRRVIVVTPAFTEPGVTGFKNSDEVLDAYINLVGHGVISDAIVNSGMQGVVPAEYIKHGQRMIELGSSGTYKGIRIHSGEMMKPSGYAHIPGGPVYARHDPEILSEVFNGLLLG